MDTATDPPTILRELDAIRAATLRRLAELTQEQLDWRPPGGEDDAAWSVGEILMHLAIDEYYLGEQLGRLWLEGVRPLAGVRSLRLPPHGVAADDIRRLFADTRTRTRSLIATGSVNPNLALRPGGAPTDGAEWLTAFGEHEVSHQRQIDALLARLHNGFNQDTQGRPC
jgi:hypothetical protein